METQDYTAQASGANLIVIDKGEVSVQPLDGRSEWLIGRYHPDIPNTPEIRLSSMIASKEHGWIRHIEDQWYYVDNPKNLNGTFYNGTKISRPAHGKVRLTPLEDGDILRIDSEDLNRPSAKGVLMLFITAPAKGTWTSYQLGGCDAVIGRASSCNIVEPIPYVSLRHAKITYVNGSYYLSDCDSRAGTFLNGKQVKSGTLLREKDRISFCDCNYFFLGDRLLYAKRNREREQATLKSTAPGQRPVVLSADIQSKLAGASPLPFAKRRKELLRNIRRCCK